MAAYEPAEALGAAELQSLATDFADAELGQSELSEDGKATWTNTQGWYTALMDLVTSIPRPPDNVPVLSGHAVAAAGNVSNHDGHRGSPGRTSRPVSHKAAAVTTNKGLLFTFCTEPNVNMLTVGGGFERVRDCVQLWPGNLKELQESAITRVRGRWAAEKETAAMGGEWSATQLIKGVSNVFGAGEDDPVGATLVLSKCVVAFGISKLNVKQSAKVQLSFEGAGQWQVTVNHIPSTAPADAYELTIEPRTFTVSKDNPTEFEVTCAMHRPDMKLQEMLVLEMGPKKHHTGAQEAEKQIKIRRLLVFLGMSSASSVFGVPHEDVELEQVDGVMVPAVLELLKAELFDSGGLTQEGVFRKAGEKHKIDEVKTQLNRKNYVPKAPTADIHCCANLIKIWFREMPKPVLASLRTDDLLNLKTQAECVKLLERIPQPNHGLCLWCLDLLLEIIQRQGETKMSAKNCAIVMAPNFLANPGGGGGMKSIMMLQKSVFWLQMVLEHRLKARAARLSRGSCAGSSLN